MRLKRVRRESKINNRKAMMSDVKSCLFEIAYAYKDGESAGCGELSRIEKYEYWQSAMVEKALRYLCIDVIHVGHYTSDSGYKCMKVVFKD